MTGHPSSLTSLIKRTQEVFEPPPLQEDIDFRPIAARWRAAWWAGRKALLREAAGFDYDERAALPTLSWRATEWALNDGDPTHLDDALDALVIDDFSHDWREHTMQLALIWHVAELLDAKPMARFKAAARRAARRAKDQLKEFMNRAPGMDMLETFEFEVVEEAGHKRFRQLPPPWERERQK